MADSRELRFPRLLMVKGVLILNSRAITKKAIDNNGAYWQCCCPYRVVSSVIWLMPRRVPYETQIIGREAMTYI